MTTLPSVARQSDGSVSTSQWDEAGYLPVFLDFRRLAGRRSGGTESGVHLAEGDNGLGESLGLSGHGLAGGAAIVAGRSLT